MNSVPPKRRDKKPLALARPFDPTWKGSVERLFRRIEKSAFQARKPGSGGKK